jgi:hypothetical protein
VVHTTDTWHLADQCCLLLVAAALAAIVIAVGSPVQQPQQPGADVNAAAVTYGCYGRAALLLPLLLLEHAIRRLGLQPLLL